MLWDASLGVFFAVETCVPRSIESFWPSMMRNSDTGYIPEWRHHELTREGCNSWRLSESSTWLRTRRWYSATLHMLPAASLSARCTEGEVAAACCRTLWQDCNDTHRMLWNRLRVRFASVNVPRTLSIDLDMRSRAVRLCSYADCARGSARLVCSCSTCSIDREFHENLDVFSDGGCDKTE